MFGRDDAAKALIKKVFPEHNKLLQRDHTMLVKSEARYGPRKSRTIGILKCPENGDVIKYLRQMVAAQRVVCNFLARTSATNGRDAWALCFGSKTQPEHALPPYIESCMKGMHRHTVKNSVIQLFNSQKGARQSALSTGSRYGQFRLRSRRDLDGSITIDSTDARITVENGRAVLCVFPRFLDQGLILTSAPPTDWTTHGCIRIVRDRKANDSWFAQFLVTREQFLPAFDPSNPTPQVVAAVDPGVCTLCTVFSSTGEMCKFGIVPT